MPIQLGLERRTYRFGEGFEGLARIEEADKSGQKRANPNRFAPQSQKLPL